MKIIPIILLSLSMPTNADMLVMKNGDRITGKITQIWDSEVSIEPSYSDEFNVDIDEIESIVTDEKFEVELSDGRSGDYRFNGKDDSGKMILAGETGNITISFGQLNRVEEIEAFFNWDSKLDFNQTFSRGNTNSQTSNLHATLSLNWGDHRSLFDLSTVRDELDGNYVKDSDRLNLSYNWLFKKPWFIAANVTAERDPISLLEKRYSFSPALGYDIWDSPDLMLNVQLGAGYQTEKIDNVAENGSLIDWRLRYEQEILNGKMDLFHNHKLYKNLEGRKNLVLNSQTGIRFDLRHDIYLNVQLNYDYDSVPADGTEEENLTFLFGAGIEF
ncbi:MAG: DUF481 domain-containing protein [Pseudomonadales bacterium]